MAADDLVEVEGEVIDVYPSGFRVRVEQGAEVLAHLGGKLRKNRIRVVLGDRVTVAVSPYDLAKGRIIFRHK